MERFNKTLCEALAKTSENERTWDEHIEEVLFAYRTNKYNTTKKTPFYLQYGREAKLPMDQDQENAQINLNEGDMTLPRIYELMKLSE